MNSRASAFALVVLATGCAPAPPRPALPAPMPLVERSVRVQVGEEANTIRQVPLEEYVQGTILSEFAPASGDEAVVQQMFAVQAIVARTYALVNLRRHASEGFELCSTTHCQLYQPSRLATSRWVAAARVAVSQTAGRVLWHTDEPASALFHADCGGHTSTAALVWGATARPYLIAGPDDDVDDAVHSRWRYDVPVDALRRALNADARTQVGNRLDAVKVVDRDVSGRADTVAVHGARERLVRGEELRSVLTAAFGPGSIRSTLFTVRRERGTFVFEGRGFGHGVGLCQAGAYARIRSGATPEAVLFRYFPSTVIRTL